MQSFEIQNCSDLIPFINTNYTFSVLRVTASVYEKVHSWISWCCSGKRTYWVVFFACTHLTCPVFHYWVSYLLRTAYSNWNISVGICRDNDAILLLLTSCYHGYCHPISLLCFLGVFKWHLIMSIEWASCLWEQQNVSIRFWLVQSRVFFDSGVVRNEWLSFTEHGIVFRKSANEIF